MLLKMLRSSQTTKHDKKTSLQCVGLTKLLCAIDHATEVFTMKITGLPNMVCMVNMQQKIYRGDYWFSKYGYGHHVTEDLQHRILDFSKCCPLIQYRVCR